MMRELIETKLHRQFSPHYLDVRDESYQHNVPVGAESHFKIVMVSDQFTGLKLIARHRAVYHLLEEELNRRVHALALHLYTISEWQQSSENIPSSPRCRGGEV